MLLSVTLPVNAAKDLSSNNIIEKMSNKQSCNELLSISSKVTEMEDEELKEVQYNIKTHELDNII